MAYGFFREDRAVLPHPPIPLAMFLIVEEAMRVAWQKLRDRPSGRIDLSAADEDQITHEFYEVLYDEVFAKRLVDGFDPERFTLVVREAKLRNFDGANLDKMPDLLIGLAGREEVFRQSQDWIFVECKPVDATHTVGVHYGAKGIARFVKGEYAWALPNALMVGYTKAGYDLVPKLVEALQSRSSEFNVLEQPTACSRSIATTISAVVHFTRHGRSFVYVETRTAAPPIRLRHLWLRRP